MDKLRLDHKCDQAEAERFLATVGGLQDCTLKDFQPVTEKCHIVRYKYLLQNEKVGVLYDTKAHILSVTAPQPVLDRLKKLLPIGNSSENKQQKPQTGAADKKTVPQQPSAVNPPQTAPKKPQKKQTKTEKTPSAQPHGAPQNKQKPATAKKNVKKPTEKTVVEPPHAVSESAEAGGQDYTVKNFAQAQLDRALKGLKKLRGVSYRLENTVAAGTPSEVKTYVISNRDGHKAKLRYMPDKKIVQLQGKRSNLYGEVQAILAGDADYVSAVKPHIELSGAKTGDVQKKLKKRLPDAFDYLSEQSKIDLTIGLIDIYNPQIKLTDYSSLLTPPYRGLEKFISDLQKAQDIEVKMIGQAFDKVDGKYVLKAGYVRRIRSVIYAEVLAALYSEYFASRNFYLHSDNSEESAPRMIGDKSEVQAIFERLLDTINYNSKKLKEIGFSL